MPTISNMGAGSLRNLSPGNITSNTSRSWPNTQILTNTSVNTISANTIYTPRTVSSLHNTTVYKNTALTQKLNNTSFKVGTNYFYADNNGWAVGIHNFDGPGDTYITAPKTVLDFRTENLTIEMFVYAKSLPSWEYSAYLSVFEPRHCQRVTGFFGSSNGIYGAPKQSWAIDYKQGNQYSKINPGMDFCGMCNEIIYHDYDTERPNMPEGFTREQWHHVAFTRHNGILRLYFNGALADIRTQKNFNCDWKASTLIYPCAIGCRNERCFEDTLPAGVWNGFISDVRIIKSQALYTGTTYTVPTRPLTATGHRAGNQNITGEIRLLACQDTLKTIGPELERVLVGA